MISVTQVYGDYGTALRRERVVAEGKIRGKSGPRTQKNQNRIWEDTLQDRQAWLNKWRRN